MDPHRNVFYYYRGASRDSDELPLRDPQLENNTTKALVNLLEFTPPDVGLKTFFRAAKLQPPRRALVQKPLFSLQRMPEAVSRAQKKMLVVITSHFSRAITRGGTPGGNPDAWVYSPSGSWAVMIESKVLGPVGMRQISGHLRRAGWRGDVIRGSMSWSDLHRQFATASLPSRDRTMQFLVGQFVKYLEAIGMSRFNGFDANDFAFFVEGDKDYRPILKEKLHHFAEAVAHRLPHKIQREYGSLFQGKLRTGTRGAWVAIRSKRQEGNPFKFCNFTIELDAGGVEFNAVIRGGRVEDKRQPIGILYGRIRNHFADFQKLLRSLGKSY